MRNFTKSIAFSTIIVFTVYNINAIDYKIEGTINVPDGTKIYMSDYMMDGFFPIDSTYVKNNKFTMKGNYDRNADVRIETADFRQFASGILDTLLVLNFETHLPDKSSSVINQRLLDFTDNWKILDDELQLFSKELSAHGFDEDEIGEIYSKLYYKLRPKFYDLLINTLKENYNNGLGEEVLLKTRRISVTPDEWDEFYALLGNNMKALPAIKQKNEKYQNQRKSEPGNMFIDFRGKNLNGEEVCFSDIVGKDKYVLVDFWASWCGPCIEEGKKTLIPLYEKYADNDKFEILSVAVWDNVEKTKQRLEQQGYQWPQIIDAGMVPMNEYGFDAIPMIMLFAPDGTILEKELRGNRIEAAVDKYLSN